MGEPSKLRSLEESLKFAKDTYLLNAKIAGESGEAMPMSLDQWLTQARERHAVLSSMDSDQMEIALEEAQRENLPMLMAQREFLDNMLAMLDPKRGGSESKGKKFAASIVKKAHKIEQEAKKVSRQP